MSATMTTGMPARNLARRPVRAGGRRGLVRSRATAQESSEKESSSRLSRRSAFWMGLATAGAAVSTPALAASLTSRVQEVATTPQSTQGGAAGAAAAGEGASGLRGGATIGNSLSSLEAASQYYNGLDKVGRALMDTKIDLFRDTWLRYAGYANEVGESFKCNVPDYVYKLSYVVAISYVVADATTKGAKALDTGVGSMFFPARAFVDTLIWQGLASVICPGYTINRVVWAANKGADSLDVSEEVKRWGPTCAGLMLIPFIVHPIDHGVTKAMDLTVRQIYD